MRGVFWGGEKGEKRQNGRKSSPIKEALFVVWGGGKRIPQQGVTQKGSSWRRKKN